MLQGITSIFVLAVLVEGIIEYFVSNPEVSQPWLKYVSAALGVAVCIVYGVDLLKILGLTSIYPFVGEILTGLVIGRGSNYLNDFVTKVRRPTEVLADITTTTDATKN